MKIQFHKKLIEFRRVKSILWNGVGGGLYTPKYKSNFEKICSKLKDLHSEKTADLISDSPMEYHSSKIEPDLCP